MLSKIKDFVYRHRRKFIVGGVIIGGTVLAVNYVQGKLREFQEKQAKEFIERTKRMQHFESTERTCNQAILGLGSNVFDEIIKLIDTNELLVKLRKTNENKIDLWNEMKIQSFTRLTAFVYASSMLVVTLRVQINLLGGYIYKDRNSSEVNKISEEIRQTYLSLVQNFLNNGVNQLIQLIEKKVREIMESYKLTQNLTLADIEQLFWSIQMSINSDVEDPNSKIAKYVLPGTVMDSELLEKMFAETLDFLESDDVTTLCSNNVSSGFSIVVDTISEYYTDGKPNGNGVTPLNKTSANSSKTQLNSVFNINQIEMPLVKIIPIVSGLTSKGFDSNVKSQNVPTALLTFFLVSEKVKTLGANVYEVFSV